jgi:hypothetical protein
VQQITKELKVDFHLEREERGKEWERMRTKLLLNFWI